MSRGWIWGGFCTFWGQNRKSSQGGVVVGGGGGRVVSFLQSSEEFTAQSAFYPY